MQIGPYLLLGEIGSGATGSVACCLGGQLVVWSLAGEGAAQLLNLGQEPLNVCAIGGELTARGALIRLGK